MEQDQRNTRIFGVLFLIWAIPARWDTVILVFPRGHGVHVHELIGTLLVALGTVVLWRSPRPID